MTLRSCRGCSCQAHTLWTRGEALFGFLPPGEYVLTLCRGRKRLTLLAGLSPGSNAELFCRLDRGCCRWRRDGRCCFFNRR